MNLEKQGRGSLSTEVVLLVPVMMLMVMFVVFVGRVQSASMAVRYAVDVGARSGSVAHTKDAKQRSFMHTNAELASVQHLCSSTRIHTETQKIDSEFLVVATAHCVVRVHGLSFLGLSGPTVRATSTEVIDQFRSSR